MALRILVLQSEMQSIQPLTRYFTQRGDEVWQSWELKQAWALIVQVQPHLMFMDLHFGSDEWIHFLRRVRQEYPKTNIIMTSQYPDLQREMLVREQNVQVFLRQPFSARWIEQALNRLNESAPLASAEAPDESTGETPARQTVLAVEKFNPKAEVRVPVRVKITLPYLLLVLLFALASTYLVGRVVLESVQDRFLNQLIETGKQSTDWMVREENRLLGSLRLIANTQGVAEAVLKSDSEGLRGLVLPIVVNSGEEMVEILNPQGVSVLSVRLPEGKSVPDYTFTRGETIFQQWDFVRAVQSGTTDGSGDKFAGISRPAWGNTFYVSGPVVGPDGELAGIVLVGKSLNTMVRQMQQETWGDVTLYDAAGFPLASTLFTDSTSQPVNERVLEHVIQNPVDPSPEGISSGAVTRDLTVSTVGYSEILAPWEVRGNQVQGVLGVSLAQAFLVRTSQVTQMQVFAVVVVSILLVLLVGISLASRITHPLQRLVHAATEVAHGNLEVKVDAGGNDELAVLARSFNYMVAGLQEGSIYRDLLGRTVSPEVREQLRQTFTSGSLRLEGQQAVAAVLFSDIRGFTRISEKADPATVFHWLNEYFAQVVPIVAAHGGVVNKFDGDAMLAFFGILPRLLEPEKSALAACQAGLEILEAVDRLNDQRLRRGEPPLVTGIGINIGPVIAGGLGTTDRMHYTIIGDTVNTAQRIEVLTRDIIDCSGVLVSQSTWSALAGAQAGFDFMALGEHNVKGKQEPIEVYRLFRRQDEG